MTVIAFRPRPRASSAHRPDPPVPVTGTVRVGRARTGPFEGTLRVRRLVIVPRGAFVAGVLTGELRDPAGNLLGVDSRRVTPAVDLVRQGDAFVPVARASRLDLAGLVVDVDPVVLDVPLTLPWRAHPSANGSRATVGRVDRGPA